MRAQGDEGSCLLARCQIELVFTIRKQLMRGKLHCIVITDLCSPEPKQ